MLAYVPLAHSCAKAQISLHLAHSMRTLGLGYRLRTHQVATLLLPEEKFEDFERPEPTIPKSIGHHTEWIQAIKNGGTTTCNFDYSGALTEAVLLGTVSYRSGKTIEWDAETLKVTNAPEAQSLIHKEYRKGWTL